MSGPNLVSILKKLCFLVGICHSFVKIRNSFCGLSSKHRVFGKNCATKPSTVYTPDFNFYRKPLQQHVKSYIYFLTAGQTRSSSATRQTKESGDENKIIAISAPTAAVACTLIIAVLVGYMYVAKLRNRRMENNANTFHRFVNESKLIPWWNSAKGSCVYQMCKNNCINEKENFLHKSQIKSECLFSIRTV